MYEIIIHDIPDEGLSIDATKSDPWIKSIIDENLKDTFFNDDKFNVNLLINKNEKNIIVDGNIDYSHHPNCDRCLESFLVSKKLRMTLFLLPTEKLERNKHSQKDDVKSEEEMDDSDVIFYSGDRFDLQEIVREFFILNLPLKNVCKESCKGICPICGADLNKDKCKCEKKEIDPRWGPLAKLKGR